MPEHLTRRSSWTRYPPLLGIGWAVFVTAGCGAAGSDPAAWGGSIDTLANGTIEVTNPARGLWDSTTAWRVSEVGRIGAVDGTGPAVFGQITTFEIDAAGRLYVFEGQTQELRVFDRQGAHVRTIGRTGGGPGEFAQVVGMDWAPDGTLWVVDPGNARISVYDTAGTYLRGHRALGGMVIFPWPGGFDEDGWFYNYAPDARVGGFGTVLVRYDAELQPVDTIWPPVEQDAEFFEATTATGGRIRAGIPFRSSLRWRLTRSGELWFAMTGDYRIFERTLEGDTIRVVTRAFTPQHVTSEDIDSALNRLEWFTRQGGKVNRSRFPDVKPVIRAFYLDDEGYLWVLRWDGVAESGRTLEVFERDGRFLGVVELPFVLSAYPEPVIRGGYLYGVVRNELEVPFVVTARIDKP